MLEIAAAGESDWPDVVRLVGRLLAELEDSPGEFAGLDARGALRSLESAGRAFQAFVAREGPGEPVGVLTLTETFALYAGGRYGVIDELYVAPECRARGVGRALLDAALSFGRARGWRRIDVTAPPGPKWERTVRFYESQGFVFTGPKLRRPIP
jgi:GNAT superfamily N-acetyltransferase